MLKIGVWVRAARLRTLPLSLAGIIAGAGLAQYYGDFNITVFVLSMFTTVGFQITSNFANDYGDGVKGTDNEDRIGPQRALQSGQLSRKALKTGIIFSAILNLLLVFWLLYVSFGTRYLDYFFLFLGLGLLSIWAAIRYTVGASAYGYKGLGDLFVFVFFGLLGVLGSMFLHLKAIPLLAVLPACTIGFLSVGVLNLNNLRDISSDQMAGKNTLVVKLGFTRGKYYHVALLLLALLCMVVFTGKTVTNGKEFITLLAFLPVLSHLFRVAKAKTSNKMDPELKKLAICTLLVAVLLYISYNYFS